MWLGDVPFASAVSAGAIRRESPRTLQRAFPGWLQLSVFATARRT